MIEVQNLVKRFGENAAVDGVTFTIRPGEVVGYLGPNGAGKSTTVKTIVGTLTPTEGQIRVCGHDVAAEPLEAKRKIGYVPESAALYNSLTPHEYLSLMAELHEVEPGLARDRIRQLLEKFSLLEAADRQIDSFSKGMRQKVLLIGALIHDPEVVLFDEPLNGLDVNAALIVRTLIADLAARGRTILYCSHILDVVERMCARVIVIDRGRIVADDATERLLQGSEEGTLESVFRSLTRREEAEETVGEFLDAIDID